MLEYKDINDDISLSSVFKRDPAYIKSLLVETGDDRIVTKKPVEIIFPENYLTKHLAKLDKDLELLGIFAIVDRKAMKYAVFSIPGMIQAPIQTMRSFTYQEEVYRVLEYQASDTLILNTNIVADELLDYYIYDYFVALARIPWYMNYLDVLTIYDKDAYYIGKNMVDIPQVIEMILANIARDNQNDKHMYRDRLKSLDEVITRPPTWVPLRNVSLGSVDTYNKIMGSYFDDGLTSALAEKSKKMTRIEKVLRS